ncbi:hypothetical protein HP456_03795 [Bacillus haikouensis]|uniref:hypothetical protein n=1 Tax=Bacillus haikouensis TaxID=1510468 RepID=UPI001551C6FA|nr:hypothetical protein [Bacillus haikouensis]NQD65037.1 hypothetical protein [Bacillus haikouensis]
MKQYDEKPEFDETLKSLDSIIMEESDKEEVYSNLMSSVEKKKSKNKVSIWSNHILSAAFIVIFLAGGGYFIADKIMVEQAAPHDDNIETIETVLKKSFSGPDKELTKILNKKESYIDEDKVQEYQNELFSYYENVYQPYFEENRFQDHVMNNKLTYNELAYSNGYHLETARIDVKEDEKTKGAYEFTVHVQYKKDENEAGETTVSGRVNIYEKGKINSLRYYDDGGLEKLAKAIQTER